MLKKFLCSLLMVAVVLIMMPEKASAAVLPWEAMVNPTQTDLRAPGFGDDTNVFVVSTATFNNYLYVATYNDGAGTEIWRTNNGTSWEQSNQDNFGSAPLTGFVALGVFGSQLYAFRAQLGPFGVDAFRTSNGTTWELAKADIANDLGASLPYNVVTYGGSLYVSLSNTAGHGIIMSSNDGVTWVLRYERDILDSYIQSMTTFKGKLYFGLTSGVTGGEVYSFDGTNWTLDNINGFDNGDNLDISSLTEFNGSLYATTNNDTGAEVWRTLGDSVWQKVADTGFTQNLAVQTTYSSKVFKGYLYVGAQTSKIFRTPNGTDWEQVNADGFGYADNELITFGILGDYLYAGVGSVPEFAGANTVEIYRYGVPSSSLAVLPAIGTKHLNFFNQILAYISIIFK